eukprot:scaffold11525_cov135-Cylindrotheca_fusiformis.AAC.1
MADSEQATARAAVMECEQEIQSVKAALRQLGSVDSGDQNSLEVVLLKVEGVPAGAKPQATLQLSSPIEEKKLTEVFDPSKGDANSKAIFTGVETTMATLTVSAFDADIPLGTSASHDLAPLCTINAMELKEAYESEVPIAILPVDDKSENKIEESKVGDGVADSKSSDEATVDAVPIQPVCTLTFRITYKPSPKDQREELYELLNKTSQRKATALENLRKISMTMARAGAESSPASKASSSNSLTKPSVKPGFLNKKKKEPSKMEKLYERTLGPNSILRKSVAFLVFAKDYVIFIGAVSFFHFQGQVASLPAPLACYRADNGQSDLASLPPKETPKAMNPKDWPHESALLSYVCFTTVLWLWFQYLLGCWAEQR